MKTRKNSIVFAIALISLIALIESAQAQDIDLTVDRIDVNRDVPYFDIPTTCPGDTAFGPTDHPGNKTQCNNISAEITELEGNATGPFHVNFSVNGGPEICQVNVTNGLNGGETRLVWCNCSWYPVVGSYTITVTADCKFNVTETNETNNTLSRDVTAVEYGFKGNSHQDGRNITTLQCHGEDTIKLIYSVGDSIKRGSLDLQNLNGVYPANWTASDLPIPAGATIVKARLYAYYNWDKTARNLTDNLNLTFNGHEFGLGVFDKNYSDRKFPSLGATGSGTCQLTKYNYGYGMLAWDVNTWFNAGGDNTARLNSTYYVWNGRKTSMTGMLLVVVYKHSGEPNRRICICEGFDNLKAGKYPCRQDRLGFFQHKQTASISASTPKMDCNV